MLFDGLTPGVFLLLTLSPILFLYPAARAIIGGRDGILAAFLAVVASEYLKSKLTARSNNQNKR